METKLQPSINIPNHAISFYIPPEDFLPVPFLFNLLKYRLYTPTLLTSKEMSVTEGKAAIMMNEKKHDREERGSPMCLSYWTTWYMCTPSVIWIQILFFSPFFFQPPQAPSKMGQRDIFHHHLLCRGVDTPCTIAVIVDGSLGLVC